MKSYGFHAPSPHRMRPRSYRRESRAALVNITVSPMVYASEARTEFLSCTTNASQRCLGSTATHTRQQRTDTMQASILQTTPSKSSFDEVLRLFIRGAPTSAHVSLHGSMRRLQRNATAASSPTKCRLHEAILRQSPSTFRPYRTHHRFR